MSKKSYSRIKNYTTSISAEKTIAEIEKMLAVTGACKIMKEYDETGKPVLLAFTIKVSGEEMPVKLPLNITGILNVFKIQVSNGKLPKKYWGNEEQARRVGWRILIDWLDSQLALLSVQMVKVEEIFLPYIYDPVSKKTMFQIMEEKKFNINAITHEENSNEEVYEEEVE